MMQEDVSLLAKSAETKPLILRAEAIAEYTRIDTLSNPGTRRRRRKIFILLTSLRQAPFPRKKTGLQSRPKQASLFIVDQHQRTAPARIAVESGLSSDSPEISQRQVTNPFSAGERTMVTGLPVKDAAQIHLQESVVSVRNRFHTNPGLKNPVAGAAEPEIRHPEVTVLQPQTVHIMTE